MERWTSLSPRLVSESEFRFTGDFFAWLRRQVLWIEDFPYADVDFRRSMDLILPMERIGMSRVRNQVISCRQFLLCFLCILCIIFFLGM